MNKYLVIVIGKQFIHPMFISGDDDKMLDMLSNECRLNDYMYIIYKDFNNKGYYLPFKTLTHGSYEDFSGYHVKGVIYNG